MAKPTYDIKKTSKKAGLVFLFFLVSGIITELSVGGQFSHFAYAGTVSALLEGFRDAIKHGAFN